MKNIRGKHVSAMGSEIIDPLEFRRKTGIDPDVVIMSAFFFEEFINNPNILYIYAGYVPGPTGINIINCDILTVANYIKENYKNNMKIVFDNLYEGGIDNVISQIHKIIDILNINPRDIYYITCVLDFQEQYEDFCNRNNITEKIHIYSANTWEFSLATSSAKKLNLAYSIGKKEKVFLCLNRIIRFHRLMLVCLLIDKNLVDKAYYSFFIDRSYSMNTSADDLWNIFSGFISNPLFTQLKNVYSLHRHIFPLTVNIKPDNNKNYVDEDDIPYYQNSYFSLVTETFFFDFKRDTTFKVKDEHAMFFSEKIFKPIAMMHPFIIVGKPYSLDYLRKIGYRTFSPFIDESYDLIRDHEKRLLAIVEEVHRLSKFSDIQWIEWQTNMKEIVEHNYFVFRNKKFQEYIIGKT